MHNTDFIKILKSIWFDTLFEWDMAGEEELTGRAPECSDHWHKQTHSCGRYGWGSCAAHLRHLCSPSHHHTHNSMEYSVESLGTKWGTWNRWGYKSLILKYKIIVRLELICIDLLVSTILKMDDRPHRTAVPGPRHCCLHSHCCRHIPTLPKCSVHSHS